MDVLKQMPWLYYTNLVLWIDLYFVICGKFFFLDTTTMFGLVAGGPDI